MVGDEADLYCELAPRVQAAVRQRIRGSDQLVEDACHTAWVRFIERSEHITRGAALGWLVQTAIHDAYKLSRRELRDISLNEHTEDTSEYPDPGATADPAKHLEQRERLALTGQLRPRQRRLLWLQASGLTYNELAQITGDSRRTVERQVLRAHTQLRQLDQSRQAVTPIQTAGRLTPLPPAPLHAGRNTGLKPLHGP